MSDDDRRTWRRGWVIAGALVLAGAVVCVIAAAAVGPTPLAPVAAWMLVLAGYGASAAFWPGSWRRDENARGPLRGLPRPRRRAVRRTVLGGTDGSGLGDEEHRRAVYWARGTDVYLRFQIPILTFQTAGSVGIPLALVFMRPDPSPTRWFVLAIVAAATAFIVGWIPWALHRIRRCGRYARREAWRIDDPVLSAPGS